MDVEQFWRRITRGKFAKVYRFPGHLVYMLSYKCRVDYRNPVMTEREKFPTNTFDANISNIAKGFDDVA